MAKPHKIEVIGMGLSPDTILDYFQQVVKPKMLWRPVGVVLHNTEYPTLKGWPGGTSSRPITISDRLNMQAHYYATIKGWPSGPHCYVDTHRIWIFSPPWKPGTGSPSWDANHFHVELVGDYAKEMLPDSVREGGVAACAAMYSVIGKPPSLKTFKFHKEDPRTRHKRCPGVNVGSKDRWVKEIAFATVSDQYEPR